MSAVSEADHEDWAHEMHALQTRYEVLLELTAGYIAMLCAKAVTPEETKRLVEDLVDDIINSSNDQATDKEP